MPPEVGLSAAMPFTRDQDLILDDFTASIRYHYQDQSEPHEKDFLVFSHFSGQDEIFLDIGAANGISVSSFRKFNRSAKVISFEATPWLEPALAWLKHRERDRFDYFMVGAGRASEVRGLYVPCLDNIPIFYLASFVAERFGPDPIAINAMKQLMGQRSPGVYSVYKVDVQIEPIDNFALSPSLVKIDVETFEFDVLLGMTQTIHDHRPLVMIEGGNRNAEVAAFFESRGYLVAEAEGTNLRISNRLCTTNNGFFVPEERLSEYKKRGLIAMSSVATKAQIQVFPGLVNSKFESGSLEPWTPYLTPEASIVEIPGSSGKFALAEGGVGSVWQDVCGLETGTTYTVSAWVSAASPEATVRVAIAIYDPATSVATFSDQLKPTLGWQLVRHSVFLDKGNVLRIHLYRPGGAGTVYWDDVRLYREK